MATSAHRRAGQRLRRLMALLVLLTPPAAALPLAEISLVNADGSASDNSYELFYAAYGSNAVEDQNCDGSHSDFGRHIIEVDDELLHKPVFEFLMHVQQDIDCSTAKDDRQRMEVKVYSASADSLKAVDGERHHYRWKFRLADGFQASSAFTHLFQIKPVDGDDANPLFTLTARKGNPDVLQLIYVESSSALTVASVELDLLRDQWVDVELSTTTGDHGRLDIRLRHYPSGTVLLSYSNPDIDLWRSGASFNRPKWGIYRSLNDAANLRDERVRFTDFCIGTEGNRCPFLIDR